MKSCSISDGLAIFKALGSPVRVQILRLIQEKEGLNIKQIAQSLKLPVTTLSPHLNLLAEAGLIEFRDEALTHGTQKCCYFAKDWDQLLIARSATILHTSRQPSGKNCLVYHRISGVYPA